MATDLLDEVVRLNKLVTRLDSGQTVPYVDSETLGCLTAFFLANFKCAAAAPAQTQPAPIFKAKFVNWEQMLLLTLEDCVKEHDKVCSETCKCPHSAIMAARFVIETDLASKTRAQPVEPQVMHTAEQWAQKFHEAYERLAPQFGYATRVESAKPWDEVPEQNRKLMTAVCAEVLPAFAAHELAAARTDAAKVRDRFRELALAASKCECDHSDDDCCAKACPGQCAWCEYGQLFDIKFRAAGTEREPGE